MTIASCIGLEIPLANIAIAWTVAPFKSGTVKSVVADGRPSDGAAAIIQHLYLYT